MKYLIVKLYIYLSFPFFLHTIETRDWASYLILDQSSSTLFGVRKGRENVTSIYRKQKLDLWIPPSRKEKADEAWGWLDYEIMKLTDWVTKTLSKAPKFVISQLEVGN